MPSEPDNKRRAASSGAEAALRPGAAAAPQGNVPAAAGPGGPAAGQGVALVRTGETEEPEPEAGEGRLERLPMQVDVMVKVHSFRVQDLLALTKGSVVETVHEHTQDVPLRCGGALLVWAEFEVLDQQLAVRITRLA